MATKILPITSPIKGVVRTNNREGQPDGTCWDALNVLPYDRYGRKRVAQRAGLIKQWPTQLGSGDFVQGMIEAPNIVYPPNNIVIPDGQLDDLPGWTGPTFPPSVSPVGPFVNPASPTPFNVNLEYFFTFSVTASGSASTTSGPPPGSGCLVTFYFPLDSGNATHTLIVNATASILSTSSSPVSSIPAQTTISVQRGNPSGSRTTLISTQVTPAVAASNYEVRIRSDGRIVVTNLDTSASAQAFFPFAIVDSPEINVYTIQTAMLHTAFTSMDVSLAVGD